MEKDDTFISVSLTFILKTYTLLGSTRNFLKSPFSNLLPVIQTLILSLLLVCGTSYKTVCIRHLVFPPLILKSFCNRVEKLLFKKPSCINNMNVVGKQKPEL